MFATSGKATNPTKICNFVAEDEIWKSHVNAENEAAKRWPRSWGFLSTPYHKLVEDVSKKTESKIEYPKHLQIQPATPIEKYIHVKPSPAVPKTTQGFIGWRSTVSGLELERYGRTTIGKSSFFKEMKWPLESVD
uniref:Ciliary microtubule inner protein 1 n=1 Tax=Latimeria chalumnae TaxID=7897 RepID=M3XK33_LATCH|nr:PREDICTED: uncharacterized protein C20orf85 homolog [Latimeria chalumnae]|eukprot:XP_014342476.1 PREDICTED: uncharacterized protein C20orf85 homolog [Latimeria chalumnae]